jgi:uncharacterized protein
VRFGFLRRFNPAASALLVMLVGCLVAAVLMAQSPARTFRALILTGSSDQPYHDWRLTSPFLKKLLTDTGRFEVRILDQVRELSDEMLGGCDLLVLNYNGPRWGGDAEKKIEEAVRSGKGFLAVHGISYGEFFGMEQKEGRWVGTDDPGWTAYAEMLGATWKPENIGHARRHIFEVKWTQPDHPIARGLEPTFLADDELYHRMDLKPGAVTLATAYSDPAEGGTGREEPQIWAVMFGQGRAVHITLGHDLKALQQPGFIAAFTRAAKWAGRGLD